MPEFSEDYFKGSVIDGFYVRPMVKRAWAAQLKVLDEIVAICKRHNIQYYAEWGTLLGAVRHKGFVPWDDDMDIGMFREDYERFCVYAKDELPEELTFLSIKDCDELDQYLGRIVNTTSINYNQDFLEKYYWCPYSVGIDIFITDYVPRDKTAENIQQDLILAAGALAYEWSNEDELYEDRLQTLMDISEMTGVKFDMDGNIPHQLRLLTEKICAMYGEEDADDVCQIVHLRDYPHFRFPKTAFASFIDMPFENTTIPVAVGYETILTGKYGPNYMTPIKRWGTHNYPFFKEQEAMLVERFKEFGFEIPEIFDVMCPIPNERFYGIQYHKNLQADVIDKSGIEAVELALEDLADYQDKGCTWRPRGIKTTANMVVEIGAKVVAQTALALGAEYIVIDTREYMDMQSLQEALSEEIETFRTKPISCYIENGYDRDRNGVIVASSATEPHALNWRVDTLNMLCGRDAFGICVNTGYAILAGRNPVNYLDVCGKRVRLIHANENDGYHDDGQMPYTYLAARGRRDPIMFKIVGKLNKLRLKCGIIFDIPGYWESIPVNMQESSLKLIKSVANQWEEHCVLIDTLYDSNKNKKIFVFGSGRMTYNLLENWGNKFKIEALLDNNEANWGSTLCNVPIKPVDILREYSNDEIVVVVGNMFQDIVSEQLDSMGIDKYYYYNDNFYM